jgi:hypothetical protein
MSTEKYSTTFNKKQVRFASEPTIIFIEKNPNRRLEQSFKLKCDSCISNKNECCFKPKVCSRCKNF